VDQRQKSAVFSFAGAEIPFTVLAAKGLRGQDLKTIYYYIYSFATDFGAYIENYTTLCFT